MLKKRYLDQKGLELISRMELIARQTVEGFLTGRHPSPYHGSSVEYADHPWFIGVQYHPELKSKPFEPHPLFASFVAAAVVQSRLV